MPSPHRPRCQRSPLPRPPRPFRLPVILALLAFLVARGLAQPAPSPESIPELTLERTLELALRSPAVLLAQLELVSAERQLAVEAGLVSGQISTGYRLTTGQLSAPSLAEPQSLDGAGFDPIRLDLSLNVVPFGPSHDGVLQAEAVVVRAQLALRDTRAEALVVAAEDHLAALRAAQEAAVAHFAAEVAGSELEATELHFAAGTVSSSQLTQAQIALQQAENAYAAADLAAAQALRTLSAGLGVAVAEVATDVPTFGPPEVIVGDAQLMQRSDVQRALLSLAQVERNAASTLRSNLPSASLDLDYSRASSESSFGLGASFDSRSFQPSLSASLDVDSGAAGNLPEAVASSFSVRVGVTVPLDSALGDALALGELAREQALLSLEQTVTAARLAVRLSADQLASLRAAADLAAEQLEQARTTLTIAEQRFELGVVSRLDLLAAERSLREQQLRLDRARDSLLLAHLSYLRALALDPLEAF